MKINNRKYKKLMFVIISTLLVFIGTAAPIICFTNSYLLPINNKLLFLLSGTVAILLCLLNGLFQRRTMLFIYIFLFLSCLLFIFIYGQELKSGIEITYQLILKRLIETKVITLDDFLYDQSLLPYVPFLIYFGIFIIGIILSFCIVYYNSLFFLLLFTFPFIEIGLAFGFSPPYPAFFAYLGLLLCNLYFSLARRSVHKRYSNAVPIFLCTGIFLSMGLSMFLLDKMDYSRPPEWNNMRESIIKGGLKEFLSLSIFQNGYGGWLSIQGDMEYLYQTDLIINMPQEPRTFYLKGYVGSVYTGKRWKQLSDSVYEKEENLFNMFKEKAITPFELNTYHGRNNSNGINAITIEPINANKRYAYTPYSSYPNSSFSLINDAYANAILSSLPQYSLLYDTGNETSSSNVYSSNLFVGYEKDYDGLVKEYEDFVKEYYLQVPIQNKETLQSVVDQIKKENDYNKKKYPSAVRKYLTNQASYTLTPGTTPFNKDYINYFLFENQKGYCVHFATAATIMLRMLDIPARYVEGYIVTKEDFENGLKNKSTFIVETILNNEVSSYPITQSQVNMEIQDTNAHAWTEYYTESQGFIPLETTPGYTAPIESNILNAIPIDENKLKASTEKEENLTQEEGTTLEETTKAATVQEVDKVNSSPKSKINAGIIVIYSSLFVLLIFVGAICLRRLVIVRLRERSFHTRDNNTNVIAMNDYLSKLDKVHSVVIKDSIYDLILKAQYSQYTLTDVEMSTVLDYILEYRREVYTSMNWFQCLILDYWKGL